MYLGIKKELTKEIKSKLELSHYQLTGTAFYDKEIPADLDILVWSGNIESVEITIKNDFNITSDLKRVNAYNNILGNTLQFKSNYFDFLVFTDRAMFDKNVKVTLALREVFDQKESIFYTKPSKSERARIYEKGVELLTYKEDLTKEDLVKQLKVFMKDTQYITRRVELTQETTTRYGL